MRSHSGSNMEKSESVFHCASVCKQRPLVLLLSISVSVPLTQHWPFDQGGGGLPCIVCGTDNYTHGYNIAATVRPHVSYAQTLPQIREAESTL